MKIQKLFTGAIALITFSFCTAAMADEEGGAKKEHPKGERPEGGRPGGFDRAGMLKKLDTDGDGKLSDAERLAGMKERLANNPEMKTRLLEKFDEDKNGELSDAELTTAMAEFHNRGGRPGGEGKPGERRGHKPGDRKGGGKPEGGAKE